jgi:hypothetical protein
VPIDIYWLPVAAALVLLALRFRPDLKDKVILTPLP